MRRDSILAWIRTTCFFGLLVGLVGQGTGRAAGFAVNINFQPANAAPVAGYLPDVGYAFGDRGNGYAYGWNVYNTANAFQRNQPGYGLVNSGNKMQPAGESLSWQIDVPDGCYDVLLVAADPSDTGGNGTCYNINAEGTPVITNGVPGSSQWIFGTNTHVQVWVSNRRLTISNGANATNNSICYIQIQQVAPIFWGAGIIDNTGTNKAPWDYNSPTDQGVLGYHESNTVKRLSIVGWGDTWSNTAISSYNLFTWNTNVSGMSGMWDRGTIPFYTWQPSVEPTDTTNFSLQNIIAGKQDSYITTWARAAKAYGKPFFLRFAHEMNGTWYPWSEGIGVSSNAPPGSFTNMWQHVHNIFTAVGCTNATWIWCVNELGSADLPGGIAQFYPGDNYVDWLGMDAYNMNSSPPGQSFGTIFGPTYSNLVTLSPGKPIMICETATLDGGAPPGNSKPAWISDALSTLPTAFPSVRALVWYNVNNTDGDDYPIEGGENSDPYWTAPVDSNSVAAWSSGIASPFYEANIFTNQANLAASPIQPIVLLNPPSTLAASASNATMRLTWTAVAGATNYNLYRSTSGGNGTFSLLTGVTATSCTDATCAGGTTYYYLVTAQNLAGESLASPQAVVTTPNPLLSAQLTGPDTVMLMWPVNNTGWYLQAQTNAPGARITTHWITLPFSSATNFMSFTINRAVGSVFFRLVCPTFSSAPVLFATGNLVVLQVGNGSIATTGAPGFLNGYSPFGGPSQAQVALPTTGAGALIFGGSSYDGTLSLSADGQTVVVAGYNVPVNSYGSAIDSSSAATVPRAVGSINAAGVFTLKATTAQFSGATVRAAVADGGGNFWAGGGNSGIVYLGGNSPAATISTASTATRDLAFVNNSIYFTETGDGVGVVAFSGAPATAATPALILSTAGTGTGTVSPKGFAFNPALTIAYVADNRTAAHGGGLQRFNWSGSAWVYAYTLGNTLTSSQEVDDVAVNFNGPNPVLYAVTGEATGNHLITVTDAGANSTWAILETAPAGDAFRGVVFAPISP